MLLPDYHTVKVEQNERLRDAEVSNLARAVAARQRLAQPRPVFRSRTLRVLLGRVFTSTPSA
ncbi:MAG: hypothetical protein ACR2QO_26510 [Acidimicrobiales bacterium]